MNKKILVSIAVILGILLFVIAVIYFIEPAKSLPHFFPGYDATLSQHHTKHSIGAFCLALAVFAFAWFQSGKKKRKEPGIDKPDNH
jgi:amino acid permease